jgi:hypothetical protein
MEERRSQADRVVELIRWHMPHTPVRPSCTLHQSLQDEGAQPEPAELSA